MITDKMIMFITVILAMIGCLCAAANASVSSILADLLDNDDQWRVQRYQNTIRQ